MHDGVLGLPNVSQPVHFYGHFQRQSGSQQPDQHWLRVCRRFMRWIELTTVHIAYNFVARANFDSASAYARQLQWNSAYFYRLLQQWPMGCYSAGYQRSHQFKP